MITNDHSEMSFPRVTGYQVSAGRRVTPVRPVAPRPVGRMEKARNIFEDAAEIAGARMRGLRSSSWKVLGGVLGGAALVCGAIVLVFSGGGVEASASVETSTSSITAAYPSGRDRVLVGRDGDLRAALFRAAVAPGDIDRIVSDSVGAGVGEKVYAGMPIDIVFAGRSPDDAYRAVQSVSYQPRLDMIIELQRKEGQLSGGARAVAVDHAPMRVYGSFGPEPISSLVGSGVPQAQAEEYMRILAQHVDVRTISAGDRFDLIVERDRSQSGLSRTGDLMYVGLYQADGMELQLSQWTLKGKLRWFDAEEAAQSHDNIQRPVPGIVSSNYGQRHHPILGYTRMHRGMDFKAGYGTPILAVQTGWVTKAGWGNGFGNQVELRHGAGLSTTYSHMSRIGVRDGELVQQGQVIGYVGSTGLSTGAHLHYELHQNGVAIDPSSVKFTVGPQLQGSDLAGYQARLNALLKVPVEGAATRVTSR